MTGVHQYWKPALTVIAGAALLACADDAAPVAPPDPGPTLAANTEGPLAVESVIGLEPLFGATNQTSIAHDISDFGQAVGSSDAPANETHAVLWEPNTSVFPVDLGTLSGGTTSRARAINSIGTVIVGQSETANVVGPAVRWVNVNGTWTIQDLGTLPGWTFGEAFDVADDGSRWAMSPARAEDR